jgi:hypothetical protein
MLKELVMDYTVSIPKGERHVTLISVADSLLIRHLGRGKYTGGKLKDFFIKMNNELCSPEPLPEHEILSIWNSAINFVKEKRASRKENNDNPRSDKSSIVEETSENILKCYHFATIKETGEIRYYNNGVYISGGEILIEKRL